MTARHVPTNPREDQMDQQRIDRWYRDITPEMFAGTFFPGSVLAIGATDDGESRSIGSNNFMSWHKLGMVGVITSGASRIAMRSLRR